MDGSSVIKEVHRVRCITRLTSTGVASALELRHPPTWTIRTALGHKSSTNYETEDHLWRISLWSHASLILATTNSLPLFLCRFPGAALLDPSWKSRSARWAPLSIDRNTPPTTCSWRVLAVNRCRCPCAGCPGRVCWWASSRQRVTCGRSRWPCGRSWHSPGNSRTRDWATKRSLRISDTSIRMTRNM